MSTSLTTVAKAGLAKGNFIEFLLKGGFILVMAGASYFILRSVVRRIRRNRVTNSFGNESPSGRAAQYAASFYSGIMVSGLEWLNDWVGDGTDTELIFSTARQVYEDQGVTLSDCVRQYRSLYNGRDLIIDLQKDLSASDFQKFNSIINEGLGSLPILENKLYSPTEAIVYNEQFQPIFITQPKTLFGWHVESIIQGNGTILHGFEYDGQTRYVNSQDVLLVQP